MDVNPWYISSQCQTIRAAVEFLEDQPFSNEIKKILQSILVASYKIESDLFGVDVKKIEEREKKLCEKNTT